MFDGFAVLEVLLYYLGYVFLDNAEIPGARRVDDEVRAVLAEAETVHGVHADVPVHALRAQRVLERHADVFGSTLLAVTAPADEHVGVVVADLRAWLRDRRQRAVLLFAFLRLLGSLRDGFLRF
jgi:hypothetical protein